MLPWKRQCILLQAMNQSLAAISQINAILSEINLDVRIHECHF